jgi:MscS family membrane protein
MELDPKEAAALVRFAAVNWIEQQNREGSGLSSALRAAALRPWPDETGNYYAVRTLEGHLVTLPNKIVAETGINNVSMRPNIRQLLTLNLTYDTTPEKMQQAVALLREIFGQHPLTHDAWIYWKDYGPHSLDIFVVYWCKTTVFKDFLQAMEEINLEIKRRFDAAGLEFAFPTRTIHLRQINPSP